MKHRSPWIGWLPIAAAFVATSMISIGPEGPRLGPEEAQAIIGRPLTPMSYAGVARRTVRRTAYVGAAAYAGAAVATTAVAAASVAALPPGCIQAGAMYTCGATHYQAVYDGPQVVYVQR